MKRVIAAIVVSLAGASALAHGGATGAVMERMMGMSAMRDVMAELAPVMQGTAPYNARAVQENAARIMAHSGGNMTRLFPEAGDNTASYVKPELWEQWDDFERMANELRLYAEGLATAAPNGLEAPAGTTAPNPLGAPVPEAEPPRLTVAQLMGVEPRLDAVTAIAPTSSEGGVDFALMAADDVFEMVGQACSACHAQFRSGS